MYWILINGMYTHFPLKIQQKSSHHTMQGEFPRMDNMIVILR